MIRLKYIFNLVAIILLLIGFVGCRENHENVNGTGKLETSATADSNKKYRLILLAGQTNMVGAGQKKHIEMPIISKYIQYFNFGKRMNLQKPSEDSFGPEIGIMEELSNHFPNDNFILVKYAISGSSMYGWSPQRDEEEVRKMGYPHFGKMSDSLFKYTSLVIEDKEIVPEAFVWMQGETDARFETAGEKYASNFLKLIQAVRQEYGKEDLPVIFGKVNPPSNRYPGLEAVQKSQHYIADNVPNTYLVDTYGLEKHQDDLHYSSKGSLGLGHRFGKILVQVID